MRKMLLVSLMLCTVALLSVLSMPVASAQPMKPLECEMHIELNWNWVATGEGPTWIGTVQGDINGDIYFFLLGATLPGTTEHFSEAWLIVTDVGTIGGFDDGVWSFKTFEFKSNGPVTSATGDWAYLVGSYFHGRGVSTEFPVPFGTPVIGTGTTLISGPD